MNWQGILLGVVSFLIIGIWHPIVIKGEYHFGKEKCVPVFILVGLVCTAAALFIQNMVFSTAVALFGFSAFWGVKEVFEQENRVNKGWFPKKADRTDKSRSDKQA